MILDLIPLAPRTYPTLSLAIRAWQAGAAFQIHRGPCITHASPLPHGIHRARFWNGTRVLGEIELDETTAAAAAVVAAVQAERASPQNLRICTP